MAGTCQEYSFSFFASCEPLKASFALSATLSKIGINVCFMYMVQKMQKLGTGNPARDYV